MSAGLVMIGAALKIWRNVPKNEAEQAATKALAERTAEQLKEHREDCNKKNIMIALLDQRVSTIQISQSEIRKTVERMDEKLDRILEK